MTESRLKKIAEEIKKLAEGELDDVWAPAPTKPKGTGGQSPTGGQHGYASSPTVRAMQEALLRLANVASSTDVTSMTGNKEGVMEGKQDRQVHTAPTNIEGRNDGNLSPEEQQQLSEQTKKDKNYLGGSDPFGKFLVQNYIGKDSFIGKQYLNVDVAGQSNREHATMNPTNLRGIIDTIKRIGSPNAKGERVVDGVWQTRTNNALHVVADLTEAVLNLSNDMGVKLNAYDQEMLNAFKTQVPESWNQIKSSEDMNKRAAFLTKHLDAMTKMFEQFNADVLNNKAIRQFIDQREAFANFPKDNQVPPGVNDTASLPGVKLNWSQNPNENTVAIYDLSNLDNFKKFLQRMRVVGSNPSNADVKKLLDHISNAINQQAPQNTKYDPGY